MKELEPAPAWRSFSPNKKLLELLLSSRMADLMNKIHEEYYYWDKVKYQPVPPGVPIEELWKLIKIRRRSTPYVVFFGNYEFHWNLNSQFQEYLHFLDLNIGGSLASNNIISREDKNRYLLSSIMEEAIASSQIEGAVTTRKHAKDMLRKNKKPRNTSEQMIVNNFLTIQKILEIKSQPLNIENFLQLHGWVTTNTLSRRQSEGHLRDSDEINVVDTVDGTIVHHPPQVEELEILLADLFKFFNEDDPKLFIHPITKACIIHFMVGFIHPFDDGNGRTARALFYWYLLKREYWLIEYLSISRLILRSKAQYARAFLYSETDENDLTYFISYNLRTMKLAFEELRLYIRRKNEQKKQISSLLGKNGLSYRQALILDWYLNDRDLILTVKEVENRLAVSNMSARLDLRQLIDKGYLETIPLNQVTKGYVAGKRLLEFRKGS